MTREHLGPSRENQKACSEIPKFPEGSLGFPLNEYLEERERPLWLFKRKVDDCRYGGLGFPRGLTFVLRDEGITTISELLSKSKEDLLRLRGIGPGRLRRIERRVERFFKFLKFTPEMELVEVVFGLGTYYRPVKRLDPFSAEEEKELREDVGKALSSLDPREAEILTLRFGFGDWRKRDLEETARKYGVTRERIRQIETKALRKLRHPRTGGSLRLRRYLPSQTQEYLF